MHTWTDTELDMYTEAVINYGPIEPCRNIDGTLKRWSMCFVDYSEQNFPFLLFYFNTLDGHTHCIRRNSKKHRGSIVDVAVLNR